MGKAKKHKHGSKAKKHKHGSKVKKHKHGSKRKKGRKGSSSEKRSSSASSSKSHSSSQHHTKSSEPSTTSGSARGSTSSTTEGSAASTENFKLVNRPPFPDLVLPSDLESTPRRPSIVYIWDWSNVWFFPAGIFALGFIVLFMVYADLRIRSDELHAHNETGDAALNATSVAADAETAETTAGRDPAEITRRKTNATKRRRRAHLREPYDPASFSDDEWTTRARTSGKSAPREQRKTLAAEATKIGGEEEDTADVAAGSEANTPASSWLDGPTVLWRNASRASSLLVATKAVDQDLPRNGSTVSGNDG